jgi:F-type H+-transporting ATPase subunit a
MIKKRYIILLCVAGMIAFGSVLAYTRPVLPFIQLPGEIIPHTQELPLIGSIFGGLTNTFVSTLVAWTIIIVIALSLRARSRTADEVPSGMYNFHEMVIEGAYNFAERIAGPKARILFPYFMTFVLVILTANWLGLVPGVDSIGVWEYKPHFQAVKAAKARESVEPFESEEAKEDFIHEQELFFEEINPDPNNKDIGLNDGLFLIRAEGNSDPSAPLEENDKGEPIGLNPEAQQWTIVPFMRPAATDLNFTLAFALVSMFMVQYYGFKYLGFNYLAKFFPFVDKNFGGAIRKNPITAIDPAVGLLELVSEISKILSFSFRLLGNMFAGMVLLFVMALILPVANIAFFGLELFVGLIQAVVFGLLSLIFMVQATHGHGYGEDEHH